MIVNIYVADAKGAQPRSEAEVEVVPGAGIVGDRNYGRSDWPGQNVTFIESEAVARYNAEYGQAVEPVTTRRNVVTTGVDLNALVGREFRIGDTLFRGVELCTPCATLGAILENAAISGPEVVKALLTSAGLRADVVRGGRIAVGMALEPGGRAATP
jgi:MOSC domain-containing protein YiiM